MRGFDHGTILSPSFHGLRKERLAQNTTNNASETNKVSNTGAYVNMVSKIMASCSRNLIRFAQPKSNNVPSNPFGGERRKRIREINQEMNQNGDNGFNCRRLTFVSLFDFKPNRLNDNERVIVFGIQGPPENRARLWRIKSGSLS